MSDTSDPTHPTTMSDAPLSCIPFPLEISISIIQSAAWQYPSSAYRCVLVSRITKESVERILYHTVLLDTDRAFELFSHGMALRCGYVYKLAKASSLHAFAGYLQRTGYKPWMDFYRDRVRQISIRGRRVGPPEAAVLQVCSGTRNLATHEFTDDLRIFRAVERVFAFEATCCRLADSITHLFCGTVHVAGYEVLMRALPRLTHFGTWAYKRDQVRDMALEMLRRSETIQRIVLVVSDDVVSSMEAMRAVVKMWFPIADLQDGRVHIKSFRRSFATTLHDEWIMDMCGHHDFWADTEPLYY